MGHAKFEIRNIEGVSQITFIRSDGKDGAPCSKSVFRNLSEVDRERRKGVRSEPCAERAKEGWPARDMEASSGGASDRASENGPELGPDDHPENHPECQ